MTEYDSTIPNVHIAFKPDMVQNTFGEYISKKGLTQARIAETEKYAHVTFFFNGGSIEEPFEGEDRILVSSPKVDTYDMQPEMSIKEVTEKAVEAINSKKYDCIILNYANADMVGHTGDLQAAIKAIEAVDEAVGEVVKVIEETKSVLIITADHGNAEQMINYKTEEPNTAHTTNPVIFTLIGMENVKLKSGKLADIAPTMLDIMGLEKPKEMTGESLIIHT
jgi:2,3-bisphosphoglycerate-independent phosphoglycerate mutase